MLGLQEAECNDLTVVIVLTVQGRVMGAVVDAVSHVLQIRRDSIQPAPDLGATAATD
jgi:purine-binding chemotaxis protein CheW